MILPNLAAGTSILLLWLSLEACGAPTDSPTPARHSGLSMPLRRRSPTRGLNSTELGYLAKRQRDAAIAKYWGQPNRKRSTGYNLLIDQDEDSGYLGSLAIGTPLTSFDIILDTGSSDLWLVGNTCGSSSCKGLTMFDPSSSSTFKNLSSSFDIEYGSGEAEGYVAQDTVEMAGFSVSSQGFAVATEISSDLLTSPASGLMGLAWESISVSQQTPFWQNLASSGAMDSALFAFQFRRYSNDSSASSLEPGGELTFGYTNSSLYTGSIDYIDIPGTPSYWYLPLASLTVQGNSISIDNGTTAAIDTGTTNIAGPSSAIEAIYAQIEGSSAGTGEWNGYYEYPCSTSVTVDISFGGNTWTMSSADFKFAQLSSSTCIGVFFESGATGTGSTPSWIFGDAFLKNVYSVFQYNPAAVGFASLSSVAIAENGVSGAVPSATIGSTVATVSSTSGAAPRVRLGHGMVIPTVMGLSLMMAFWML